MTCRVKWRFPVGRVDQDVCIENPHLFFVQYPVEFFAVGDIDPEPSAILGRQSARSLPLTFEERGCSEDAPEPCFYKGRHGGPASCSFFLQLPHDGSINIQRSFHMDSHIMDILICLMGKARLSFPESLVPTGSQPFWQHFIYSMNSVLIDSFP